MTHTLSHSRHSYAGFIGIAAIIAASIVGWFLFPDNLALLTRIIAIALLVLSLDLVTGYCGIATLGHAALFGAGAYGAGIAAAHFGINDPILMTLIGLVAGAITGLVSEQSFCAPTVSLNSSYRLPLSICSTKLQTRHQAGPAAVTG